MNDNRELEQRLTELGRWVAPPPSIVEDVMKRVKENEHQEGLPARLRRYRIISSTTFKLLIPLAAAAVVMLVVGLWPKEMPNGTAFADVVERLRATRTVRYRAELESPDAGAGAYNVWIAEPGRARFEYIPDDPPGQNEVKIIDLDEGIILSINPKKKTATFLSIRTDADSDWMQARELEPFHTLRNLRDIDVAKAETLGEQEIDGIRAVGFTLTDPQHNETTHVWTDIETRLPIRIERTGNRIFGAITGARKEITETKDIEALKAHVDENASRQAMSRVVITSIVFDLELDESLFSLTLPDGYREGWARMPYASEPKTLLEDATEEDLLKGLRILSEESGGIFPSEKEYAERLQRARYAKPGEGNDAILRAYRYLLNRKAQYVGEGVVFGNSEEMVAGWLLSAESDTVRVVLGDLSVKEMKKNSEAFIDLTARLQKRKASLQQKQAE